MTKVASKPLVVKNYVKEIAVFDDDFTEHDFEIFIKVMDRLLERARQEGYTQGLLVAGATARSK